MTETATGVDVCRSAVTRTYTVTLKIFVYSVGPKRFANFLRKSTGLHITIC